MKTNLSENTFGFDLFTVHGLKLLSRSKSEIANKSLNQMVSA